MNPELWRSSSRANPPEENCDTDIGSIRVGSTRLLVTLLTLAAMFFLKRHYSLASAEELNWILAPTARLVAWLTPAHPVFEHGVGHVDFSRGIIIAPACAGINFLIMAFGLAVCCGLLHLKTIKGLLTWMALSFGAVYGYTLLINTLRIGISMYLYQVDFNSVWLTAERVHRLTGVGLYLGALWLLYIGANKFAAMYAGHFGYGRPGNPGNGPIWLPTAWYLAGTVGVPVINLLFQPKTPSFVEHCITLVAASTGLLGLAVLTLRLLKKTS